MSLRTFEAFCPIRMDGIVFKCPYSYLRLYLICMASSTDNLLLQVAHRIQPILGWDVTVTKRAQLGHSRAHSCTSCGFGHSVLPSTCHLSILASRCPKPICSACSPTTCCPLAFGLLSRSQNCICEVSRVTSFT